MFKEEAAALQQAVRVQPKDADAYFNLGNAYSKLNRPREAAAAYQRAVTLNPGDSVARLTLGRTYLKAGDRKGAETQHEALKSIDPNSAEQLLREINAGPPPGAK